MKKPAAKKSAKSKSLKQTMTRRTSPSKSATAESAPTKALRKSIANPKVKVKEKSASPPSATVCADHQRRTCIQLDRNDEVVRFVALDVENGLDIGQASPRDFDDRFKPLVDYPVEKAAKLYVEYARGLGATEQVMKSLGKLTTVTNEDTEMATKKKAARAAKPVKTEKKPSTRAATKKAAPAKKAPKAANGEKKERKPRGPTAASRFQELILEGKKTDDQIFATVQKEFGLDDGKRSYVKWYRNYLTKQGQNPPGPVEK